MNIYLPSDTRVGDVVDVIGILIGNEKHQEPLDADGWFCLVNNVSGHSSINFDGKPLNVTNVYLLSYDNVPSMLTIVISKNNLDRSYHECNYHFEGANGTRELHCGNSDFWNKIGNALVNFFGGKIEFEEIKKESIKVKKPRKSNSPEDGKPWQKFQQEMFDLQPLK